MTTKDSGAQQAIDQHRLETSDLVRKICAGSMIDCELILPNLQLKMADCFVILD